ncbi:MAG: diguanylate cyclase, partial [Pseudomonadota bacterium]
GNGGLVWGSFTQKDGIMLSSFAIMLAGFFYSLAILKPDMLKRNRERQLMKLKVRAAQHEDLVDKATDLYNGNYFLQILKTYLTEFNALNETLGLVLIEVKSSRPHLEKDIRTIADSISGTARDYDVIARLDNNLIAILTPHIMEVDIKSIVERFQKVVAAKEGISATCEYSFGTATNSKTVNAPVMLVEAAAQSLQIGKRLNPVKLAA